MTWVKVMLFGAVALSLFLAGCTQTSNNGTNYQQEQQGRAVFAMKDAAADMGTVTKVEVTIQSVQVHSETGGWVTLSSTSKMYDLLELKSQGNAALLADANLSPGTYNQLRLDISSVVVTDANGTHEAKLPSNELKVVGNLVVQANSTSTATFDFVADESLHVTGNGEYVMAPVVQMETRQNATVEVESNNNVHVSGGSVVTNVRVGMGADGVVGVNVHIPVNADVIIEGGSIRIVGSGSSNSGNANANVEVGIGGNANANSNNSVGAEADGMMTS